MLIKAHLGLQFRVTTQMILSGRLLRLSSADVEQVICQELADNPALENYALRRARGTTADSSDLDDVSEHLAAREPRLDQLVNQARLLVPSDEIELTVYLIHSLDEHGFLRIPEEDLARELGVSPERLARHIAWLHQLEPPGIGARDIRECLLLQCTDLEARGFDCKAARQILSAAWEPFVNQRWASVAKLTGLAHQDIEAARQFMHDNLYPYPLLMVPDVADDNDQLAYPDLVIRHTDGTGRFTVEVPAAHAYQLTINPAFRMVTHTEGVTDSALVAHEHEWIAQSIERARTFIHALDQRYTTLRRIGEFLVEYQSDFLQRGPKYLRPLTRSEAARQLDLHESTLSRAVSDKVVQLPGGKLIELDDLFDGSLAAKAVLRELVNSDGTLSDRELALRLQSASFNLSRRTVAKYRAQLRIPAHGRRKPERAIKNTPS